MRWCFEFNKLIIIIVLFILKYDDISSWTQKIVIVSLLWCDMID